MYLERGHGRQARLHNRMFGNTFDCQVLIDSSLAAKLASMVISPIHEVKVEVGVEKEMQCDSEFSQKLFQPSYTLCTQKIDIHHWLCGQKDSSI